MGKHISRAKFEMVKEIRHRSYEPGKQGPIEYWFAAVCADEVEENQRFHKYTPSGELKIMVDNPEVKFKLGRQYYLDFTEVD